MNERIELRSLSGHLLGVMVERGMIEIKRGRQLFLVDVLATMGQGAPVIFERVLRPVEAIEKKESGTGE